METSRTINIHKIVFMIWAGFLICLLISQHTEIAAAVLECSGYVRLIEAGALIGILLEYIIISRMMKQCSSRQIALAVFAIAFMIRIVSIFFSEYTPTNDFANYYEGACYFAENGFRGGLYEPLDAYGIRAFAVQAVINGFLLRILSPTLIGMQVLNSIYTAGICVLIYVLGKEIEPESGFAGACIYTFYPMGVLSVHITTNTHGAAFFMLLGLYFFERAPKSVSAGKRFWFIVMSAVCLVLSNGYHPSVIIVLCGLVVYAAGCEIENLLCQGRFYKDLVISNIRHFKGNLILTVLTLCLYYILSSCTFTVIEQSGFRKYPDTNIYLMKIVWGLNDEAYGAWNKPDIAEIYSYPPKEREDACIQMIKERLRDPKKVIGLMMKKTQMVWFGSDNYDYFYTDGISAHYDRYLQSFTDQEILSAIQKKRDAAYSCLWNVSGANRLFIYCIWILAVIGILALLFKHGESNLMYLAMYIPLGWMAFIMISEMQSRYRYQSMTIIILLAGYGGHIIRRICEDAVERLKGYR